MGLQQFISFDCTFLLVDHEARDTRNAARPEREDATHGLCASAESRSAQPQPQCRNEVQCPRNPWASTVLDSDMERAEADVHPRTLNTGLTVLDQVRSIGIS